MGTGLLNSSILLNAKQSLHFATSWTGSKMQTLHHIKLNLDVLLLVQCLEYPNFNQSFSWSSQYHYRYKTEKKKKILSKSNYLPAKNVLLLKPVLGFSLDSEWGSFDPILIETRPAWQISGSKLKVSRAKCTILVSDCEICLATWLGLVIFFTILYRRNNKVQISVW